MIYIHDLGLDVSDKYIGLGERRCQPLFLLGLLLCVFTGGSCKARRRKLV